MADFFVLITLTLDNLKLILDNFKLTLDKFLRHLTTIIVEIYLLNLFIEFIYLNSLNKLDLN